jgi:pullulanase
MPTTEMIVKNLKFIDTGIPGFIAYQISNNANGDSWKNILVLLNGNLSEKTISLPVGSWTVVADEIHINENGMQKAEKVINVPATAAYVLYSN